MAKIANGTVNGSMNTIIGEESQLEGEFDIVGSVKVEGTLKGKLKASERLVVGQGGVVIADIEVRDAIIGGEFTGTITAVSRVELESSAKVRADLKTVHLVIHEGAMFQGNIESGDGEFPAKAMGKSNASDENARPFPQPKQSVNQTDSAATPA
jgi:cytoskeletal protein CcmA (bactofilin family)